jgi:ABC-2 type transport system permease protein
MIKISRKTSIIVILSILVVLVAGAGGLIKFEGYEYSKTNVANSGSASYQRQDTASQLKLYESQYNEISGKLKTASPADAESLKAQQETLQQQIDEYKYALNNGIYLGSSSYRATALVELYGYKATVTELSAIPADGLTKAQKNELTQDKDYVNRLQDAVKNKNFSEYISVSDAIISNDGTLTQAEKEIKLQSDKLRHDLNITGETNGVASMNDAAEQKLTLIENDKLSLLDNIDTTGEQSYATPLTSQRRQEITNDIAVETYELEHNIGITGDGAIDFTGIAMQTMVQFGSIMLILLMLILAGGNISQEISSGSIKSLIISPARRWKIFTAKYLALITILLASGLLTYIVSTCAYGIFFGFNSAAPYVYGLGGTAHVMNFFIYNLAYLGAGIIEVLVFMTLGLTLSTVTRNTAASVGISIAVYFGGSIVNSLLLAFAKGEWLKFLPFNNLDIASKLFPSSVSQVAGVTTGTTPSVSTTLTFSLCYIAVILVCMVYTAFDSFTRRDIK